MNKNVIFAPHVDDELIGCWSLVSAKEISDVYYFYDLSSEREAEAIEVGKHFGFKCHFGLDIKDIQLEEGTVIYVPSSYDLHIDHKKVNRLAKIDFLNFKKMYYSIDMNRKPKPLDDMLTKKELLYHFYKSQYGLFDSSEKYWIFEDIHEYDSEKMIWVTFQKKGFHRYPEANHNPDLEDVKYLGAVHRHLFKFKVAIEVTHSNRDIEFHQFLNWVEGLFDNTLDVDYKSVEMISDDLALEISKKYGKDGSTKLIIDVSEDGECGSSTTYKI